MLILALDTTTRAGSVAVTDDDELLAVVHGDASRTHGERLPAEIAQALVNAAVTRDQLTLLTVASGPGAFTGLRIGLAAMQGMAVVLDLPVVGVSALDALAWEARALRQDGEDSVLAWMDAQRGEVFAAGYYTAVDSDRLGPVVPPLVASPGEVLDAMSDLTRRPSICVGDGAMRYRADIALRLGSRGRIVDTPLALAPAIAQIGRRLAAGGHAGPPHALQPLYVRRPDAELERQRRIE